MMTASDYVQQLQLEPHPEGGFYRRIYQSTEQQVYSGFSGKRHSMTAIQYLLDGANFSAWHRIKSDELWVLTDSNSDLMIHEIVENKLITTRLCKENPAYTVSAGHWFAAELVDQTNNHFALCHCIVSPGFDFSDFELADFNALEVLPVGEQEQCRRLLIVG